ncbi:MAG: GDSL-type esterase/lipase family protein [Prevotellaceae bacterium]|nr:GDSL-type esterase/lipase family protein [Prevotellaceae bacterium]
MCTCLVFITVNVAQKLGAEDISDESRVMRNSDTVDFRSQYRYVFPKAASNRIIDKNNELHRFFKKLNALKSVDRESGEIKTVSIVHLGDSHIQADFITGTVRRLMNRHFGNPGRGLIAPNRLMKSNNGLHYKVSSDRVWNHSFVVRPNEIPIGIAGLGLQVNDSTACVKISTANETLSGEWDFNRVTVFCSCDSASVETGGEQILYNDYYRIFKLDTLKNDIDINFTSDKNEINFFGCSLSNGNSGVFYHSIGINGARFGDFCNHETMFSQLSALEPDLVILSFGTNESMGKYINETDLYTSLAELLFHIHRLSPDLTVILTTPAETYTRNRAAPNTLRAGKVRNIIVDFAEKNGYPYWDLYKITGGKGSAVSWNKNRLMTRDKIHLKPAGYEFQGELLFEAIMKSYNSYIKENS